jgi:hypothetical protein
MLSRTPRTSTLSLAFGYLLPLGSLLAGCVSAALLAGCSAPQARYAHPEPREACLYASPSVNPLERLDPLSLFSPAGGSMGNPTVKPYHGFFAVFAPPTPPREEPTGSAEFRLTAKPVISPGEPLGLGLHVINRSRRPITVMNPWVGGEMPPTYSHYDLFIRPENEHRSYKYTYANIWRCEHDLNGSDEHTDLSPGEATSFDMRDDQADGLAGLRLFSPGRYVLWSVYRYCGSWSDSVAEPPGAMLGEYASNSVTVEVR